MTDTLTRPSRSRRLPRPAARPGLLRAGLPAAAWAAAAGLVLLGGPALLVWIADSRSGAGTAQALRSVGQLWLLAHGASLSVPGGEVGLVPLGLLALPLLLLERAARHAVRQHPVTGLVGAAWAAAAVAGPYALFVGVVAGLARTDAVQPDPVEALAGASVVALIGAYVGVLRATGLRPVLPARLRRAGTAAAGSLAVLLASAAVLVAGSLALHRDRAAELAGGSSPGLVGGIGLLLLGLVLVPTAVVWGVSWLAGPGLALGVGTSVSPFGVTLGPLPDVPLLAAVPLAPPPGWLAVLVLLAPVCAGVIGARLVERAGGTLLDGLLAAPLGGAAVAVLAAVSHGPVGGARLQDVGPSAWQVGLAVTAELALGALVLRLVRRAQVALAARSPAAAGTDQRSDGRPDGRPELRPGTGAGADEPAWRAWAPRRRGARTPLRVPRPPGGPDWVHDAVRRLRALLSRLRQDR